MGYVVSKRFTDASVSIRKGNRYVVIPKLGDANQKQLKELAEKGHPGVTKEASQSARKGNSSS